MSKATDLLSVALFVLGAGACVLVFVSFARGNELAALYWLALGIAGLRAASELLDVHQASR